MIEATLADLRTPNQLQSWNDVVHLVDARKKNPIGYFIPLELSEEFLPFLQVHDKKKKIALLHRIANAQKADPIEEGSLADGIE